MGSRQPKAKSPILLEVGWGNLEGLRESHLQLSLVLLGISVIKPNNPKILPARKRQIVFEHRFQH